MTARVMLGFDALVVIGVAVLAMDFIVWLLGSIICGALIGLIVLVLGIAFLCQI